MEWQRYFRALPSFNCPEPVLVNIDQLISKNVGQKPWFVLPEGYLKGKWLRLIWVVVVVLVGPRRAKPGAPAKNGIFEPFIFKDDYFTKTGSGQT